MGQIPPFPGMEELIFIDCSPTEIFKKGRWKQLEMISK